MPMLEFKYDFFFWLAETMSYGSFGILNISCIEWNVLLKPIPLLNPLTGHAKVYHILPLYLYVGRFSFYVLSLINCRWPSKCIGVVPSYHIHLSIAV